MKQRLIMIIVGARPHFIKAAALYRAFEKSRSTIPVLVHSGQHYDDELSGQFFREFNLPEPKYNLNIGSQSANLQIGECIQKMDQVLVNERPDLVLVIGDTNTTAAAAIATKKQNIKLGHIEAGLREWNRSIPEEINKLLTDAITDYYFCPTKKSVENLTREGIKEGVYLTGEVSLDLLGANGNLEEKAIFLHRFSLPGDFTFMTCHREVNTTRRSHLQSILEAAVKLDQIVAFSIHPRTIKAIQEFGLNHLIENDQLVVLPPLNFHDTQNMIAHATFVITDSGGIIKESYYLGTPAIIIDEQTEWTETVDEGWHVIAGADKSKIIDASKRLQRPGTKRHSLGDGKAGERILKIIEEILPC